MVLYIFLAAILISYFTGSFQISSTTVNNSREPYGRLLCQQLCSNMGGCTDVTYDESHMSCSLLISDGDGPWTSKKGNKDKGTTCRNHFKIVKSHKNTLVCVQSFEKTSDYHTNDATDQWLTQPTLKRAKLLAVPRKGKPNFITQVDLDDYNVNWFRHFDANFGTILYVPSSDTFIISRHWMHDVISFDPATETTTVLFKSKPIQFMIMDVSRDTAFYFMRNGFGKFVTYGTIENVVFGRQDKITAASVDEDNKRLYAVFYNGILSLNYLGKPLNYLRKQYPSSFLFYDAFSHLLYYSHHDKVFTINTLNRKKRKFIKIKSTIKSGLVFNNKFYFTYDGQSEYNIRAVDLKTKKVNVIHLEYTKYEFCTLLLCLSEQY